VRNNQSIIKINNTSMKKSILTLLSVVSIGLMSFTFSTAKLVSTKTHVKFYSHTAVEDIEANNYKSSSTLDKGTGNFIFVVPMQSFQFEIALMQKHFNSKKFLDTKTYSKAKFVGKITNLSKVNFAKDGSYIANVKGKMTLHGVTKDITESGKVIVKDGNVSINTTFNLTLADYNIAFEKGKPSSNIAKTVKITAKANY